ncbi:MAG TPA: hypothetical protein VGF14_06040 [Alphaproteobacteria bacterium]
MSFLSRIQRSKDFDFTGFTPVRVPVETGHALIGWTKDTTAQAFAGLGDIWHYDDAHGLVLNPIYDTYEKRTQAVDATLLEGSAKGFLPEKPDYEALGMGGDDWMTAGPDRLAPLFEYRRFYAPHLGIRRHCSRLNAYHGDQMWIVKRGPAVHIHPGKLDNLVGAAHIAGHTIRDYLIIEAHEEAGLSPEDCRDMRSVSMLHTMRPTGQGFLFDEVHYIHDLDTKGTITPQIIRDWEVESIELWSFEKVLDVMKNTDDFAPIALATLIDFFMRHGVITPDNEPDYDALCFAMRSQLPSPVKG